METHHPEESTADDDLVTILYSIDELLGNDEKTVEAVGNAIVQFTENEDKWHKLWKELTTNCEESLYHEKGAREYQGRHEDVNSHPHSFTNGMSGTENEDKQMSFMREYIQDQEFVTGHKATSLDVLKSWGVEGNDSSNIRRRVEILQTIILPLGERLSSMKKRFEALGKSTSTNKTLTQSLVERVRATLDAEEEAINQASAGSSFQMDDTDRISDAERATTERSRRLLGLPNGPLTSAGRAHQSGIQSSPYTTNALPLLPQTPFGNTPDRSGREGRATPTIGVGESNTTTSQSGSLRSAAPKTELVASFKLKTLESLKYEAVKGFVNELSRMAGYVDAEILFTFLHKDVVNLLDTLGLGDKVYTKWRTWGKDEMLAVFEETILRNKTYEQTFEDLLGRVDIPLDTNSLTIVTVIEGWKEMFELQRRYETDLTLAEKNSQTWKKLWPLFIVMLEKGHCGKRAQSDKGPWSDVSQTMHLRKDVATGLKKRCLLQPNDPEYIGTTKEFWVAASQDVVKLVEFFNSKSAVFAELSRGRGAQGADPPYKKQKHTDTQPKTGGWASAGAGASSGKPMPPMCPEVGCGKRHLPPCDPAKFSSNKGGQKPATAWSQAKPPLIKTLTVGEQFAQSLNTQQRQLYEKMSGESVPKKPTEGKGKGKGKGGYNADQYRPKPDQSRG